MAEQKGQNYLHGAAILTLGVIIMKILGFLYKMPVANIIGPDGYSMFMQTYNVYNVFLTLSTAGLPIALARMISEANAENRPMQARRIFRVAWRTFLCIGLVFSLIMLLFPDFIAGRILHNPPAAMSIRTMAPSVLLVCLVSAYRGYCQGYGNMIPTTVGQVLEVLVKVVVGLTLAWIVMHLEHGKPMGSAAAIFGVSAGSAAALLYMWIYKRRHYSEGVLADPDMPDPDRRIFKRFMRIGIPIALGSSVLAILNLVDSGLTMGRLQSAAGFDEETAQTLYGVYGKALNLFNLPAAFITPLTISIVPAISAAIAQGKGKTAAAVSEDSMRISALLATPMGVGLAVLSEPIMKTLYPGSHEAGSSLLVVMGAASFFVCILLMENAILQASGKEKLTMVTLITGGAVKVVTNWFLVAQPSINIYGAPVGTLLSYLVMAVMNYVFICRELPHRPRLTRVFAGPLMASALMGLAAWGVYGLCGRFLMGRIGHGMLIAMALAILAAVAVYLAAIICSRSITREDMRLIPGGEKIAALLHIR